MESLEELRKRIDAIDKELLPLFLKRMECSAGVAEYKRAHNMPVLDKKREQEILEHKTSMVADALKVPVYDFYLAVMAISRAAQHSALKGEKSHFDLEGCFDKGYLKENPKVAYQGVAGAYSESALIKVFGVDTDRINVMTFREVLEALERDEVDYGVLPFENSFTGAISGVYDLLMDSEYYIVSEVDIPIEHCLVAPKGAVLEDIRTVYSHEQGMLQCKEFFKSYPKIEFQQYHNTALSAKMIAGSGDKTMAAIAGKRTAQIYNLDILAENINQSDSNTTRFAVVAKKGLLNEKCSKISIVFTLPHESGSLSRVLSTFAGSGLNLVKIESKPRRDRNFEYMFFVDYEGNLLDDKILRVTEKVIEETSYCRILGNYFTKEDCGE